MDARVFVGRAGEDVTALARRALQDRPAILRAGGGDGTLNTVANALRGTDTALGVLPLGTLIALTLIVGRKVRSRLKL